VKRSDALASLSRDHHHGLVVAQGLRRATAKTASEARSAFLSFWQSEGRRHFRVEEEVLLPALARHAPADQAAVVQVLVDHVEIRRRADDLRDEPAPALERVHELGERLHHHIRHEERVLFPLIEDALSEPELSELAGAVAQAEHGY
jgi:iron-sulfur cluster repair protein YtfE (RIC family)